MNSERRTLLLEAFASSKAAEFEGFKVAWLQANPEPTITMNIGVPSSDPLPDDFPVINVEVPKRKRKPAVPEAEANV